MRTSFVFGLVLLLNQCLHPDLGEFWTHGLPIVGVTLSALIAGALEAYADRLTPRRQIAQHTRMARIFDKAMAWLQPNPQMKPTGNNANDPERILLDLGKEALQENATWVEIHRERPIEVLHG